MSPNFYRYWQNPTRFGHLSIPLSRTFLGVSVNARELIEIIEFFGFSWIFRRNFASAKSIEKKAKCCRIALGPRRHAGGAAAQRRRGRGGGQAGRGVDDRDLQAAVGEHLQARHARVQRAR